MTTKVLALAGSLVLIALSCSKKSEDAIQNNPPGGSGCDTVNMKYSLNVSPIINSFCLDCHGTATNTGSGGIILEGYDNLKLKTDDLIGVLTHADGFPPMPKNRPQLSECNINIIRSWINNGAKNN